MIVPAGVYGGDGNQDGLQREHHHGAKRQNDVEADRVGRVILFGDVQLGKE